MGAGLRVFENRVREPQNQGAGTAPVPQVRVGYGSRACVNTPQTMQQARFFSNTLPRPLTKGINGV
jgi:hypothetical protein